MRNVSTTATYYIKTAAVDVRNAMTKLENHIAEADRIQSDTNGTLDSKSIRVAFRCWKDGVAYDERKYLASLARRGSPLATVAATAKPL